MLLEVIKSGMQDLIQSLRETKQRIKDPEGCLREMLRANIIVGSGKAVMKKRPLISAPEGG